ncbi:hypothetical protein PRZ48_014312 [Zasmidium cellare]|uniref:Heterokaryon incompatibility domain-containing protein n=1 Tax=Zasmidium cellare TaxID=395010 RepID=A0ABR0E0K3_ZASCE|nr:hypothetical protein PRZ48_014312 [Zasmidium cellare]
MRLLNKKTFEIEFFLDDEVPPYIILSHRWSGAETSMHEFAKQRHLSREHWSPGTAKVLTFCEHIRDYEEQYVWVDTCCIDKSSSAELQEAINSMFKWYQAAEECVVYMHDVQSFTGELEDEHYELEAQLKRSQWFTRGWTLQELLAPRKIMFVDCKWKRMGSREDFQDVLHEITRIKPGYYGNLAKIHSAPVAERMSWLSLRKTSRVEDMAYCMLGVFDVNMTMLYGEGPKAFIRLQKEIIQNIDDESIFVWQPVTVETDEGSCIPVLAPEVACFSICRDVIITKSIYLNRDPYRWTMKGLEFELYEQRRMQFSHELLVILNCKVDGKHAAFNIRRTSHGLERDSNVYQRLATPELLILSGQVYAYPPTAEDAYQRQRSSSVVNFESENILFKVFIQ